jgi:5-methylcytosine-specific restriction endonuclease McrA
MNSRARRRRFDLDGVSAKEQMDRIYERDKGICQLCKKKCKREDATRDHKKPFHLCDLGEARSDHNIQLAHDECNQAKANSYPKRGAKLTQTIGDLFPQLGELANES